MSNITNTCLYQACTKITNIPSQDMCLNHVPKHVPNHQPVPYQASTMYHNLYHNKCINHAPTPVPCINHAPTPVPYTSTMYINTIPSTNHVPYHVSTMYINTCTIPCTITSASTMHQTYTISCINHVPYQSCINHVPYHQPCTIYHVPRNVPLTMNHNIHIPSTKSMYQACINITSIICNHVPCITRASKTCLKHVPYHPRYKLQTNT
jgi:hypothetical protein